jgi:AcrR family transcriptional regulator
MSVAAVIERAQVSRGGFYSQFEGVDACFLAALKSCADSLFVKIERAVLADPARALEAALGELFAFVEQNQRPARALFIESLAGGAKCLDVRDGLRARTSSLIEATGSEEMRLGIEVDLLIGGVFRLLAMRLRRREAGLGDLPSELPIWIGSYSSGEESRHLGGRPKAVKVVLSPPDPPSPAVLPRGRHSLSRAEIATDQSQRILSATARVVYERGYAAATVGEIIATARVSRKAFYSQFRDREHAASEAHELFFREGMMTTAAAFFSTEEWPERVWSASEALTSFVTSRPHNAFLSFVEPHAIGEAVIQQTYDRTLAFTLFIEEGYQYRPEAEGLPRSSSEAISALTHEMVYREMRERRSVASLAVDLGPLVYLMLAPFMGPSAAAEFVEGKAKADRSE